MLVEVKYRAFFAAFLTAQSEDHFGMGAGCYIHSLQDTVFDLKLCPHYKIAMNLKATLYEIGS